MQSRFLCGNARLGTALLLGFLIGCGSTQGGPKPQGSGGSPATGGSLAAGGNGGRSGSGGDSSTGGTSTTSSSGGSTTTSSTGGSSATGGTPTGGRQSTGGAGGTPGTGGSAATGGSTTTSSTGGRTGAGGSGGTTSVPTGGSTSQGGATGTGGRSGTGGFSGTGGSTTPDGGPGDARPDGGSDLASFPEAGPEARNDVAANPDAPAYQPCPGTPCKILPLGDSITYGVNDEGNAGYRGPLFAAAVAAGKKITFTGSLANGPSTVSGQTFPKNNEGHSGWGISEVTPYSNGNAGIATVIPSPAFSSTSGGTPNIILLHIGTNDQGSFPATQMTSDLGGLIDKLITNAPDALLVVAQIIPLGYGTNDVIKAYNQAIPGLVQERAAAGKHVMLVDMYTGFTPSTMLGSDNIHPNSTGYKLMADRWYAAIASSLP